ncbi:MAG: hypothetical protein ABR502_11800, partial [Chitinophagaceae bacterium]
MIFLTLFFLISALTEKPEYVQANIFKINSAPDTVQRFSHATIISSGKITIHQPVGAMQYLA